MDTILKKLKGEFEKKKKEFYSLQNKISDRENALAVPDLKKRFEGKYFRYLNTQGGDEKWFLYSHCRQVITAGRGLIDSFEITPAGAEFSISKETGFIILNEEISELEYKNAAIAFLLHTQKLLA